jgi:hypothetical protein
MKTLKYFILVAFLSCHADNPITVKWAPPKLLPVPADTSINETGMDAVPEFDGIQVQWQLEAHFMSYDLYRRQQSEAKFSLIASLADKDSIYIDMQGIVLNKRYYYYLIGKDEDQHASAPSDTLSYMLLPKAFNLSVSTGNVTSFHWQVQDIAPSRYVLKLFEDATQTPVWFSTVPSSYQGSEEQAVFNWDNASHISPLISGGRYRWRIDIVGATFDSGSESGWHRFAMP